MQSSDGTSDVELYLTTRKNGVDDLTIARNLTALDAAIRSRCLRRPVLGHAGEARGAQGAGKWQGHACVHKLPMCCEICHDVSIVLR